MKTFLCGVLMVTMLVGCAVISPPKYYETEYRTIAEIATVLDLGTCDKETIDKLVTLSAFLDHYSRHLPNNEQTWESATLFRGQVKDLAGRSSVSETFCKLKLQVMRETVEVIQQGAGGK